MTHDRYRSDSLEAARTSLVGGRGVMIFGPQGSGRTHFLRRLVDQVDDATRQRLWIADDMERIDAARASRLVDAISAGTVLPALTGVRGRALSEPLDRLWRHGTVDRVDLALLDGSATLEIVQEILGGPLHPSAVPVFVPRRAGGDLVVLHDLVVEARSSGALAAREGVWHLDRSLQPSTEIRRLVHARVSADVPVTAEAETLLDLIALAPELSLPRLEQVMETVSGAGAASREEARRAFEALDGSDVIDVLETTGTLRLRVHDPVIELALPSMIGRLRHRRLSRAIVELLAGEAAPDITGSEQVALARLSLGLGLDVDPVTLTRLAELTLRSSRPEPAFQLASAAVQRGADIDASLVLAAAETQLGRTESALRRLEAIKAGLRPDSERTGAVDGLIAAVRSRADEDLPRWGRASRSSEEVPGLDLSSALRLNTIELPPEARASPSGDSQAALLRSEQLAVAASVAMLAGERSRALSLIDEGESLLRAIGADTFRMRFSRIIADVYDRPIPESVSMLRELRDESAAAGRAVQLGLAEELWGATQVVAGKASQALPALERAVDNLESSGFVDSAMLARVASAMAAAISGDITRARIEIDDVLPRSKDVPYIDGWALQAVAVIQARQGLFEDAAATFELAADAHDARGFSQASVIALTEAARAGNAAGVLSRIDAMADRVEGACIAVAVRQSRALAALSSMTDDRVSEPSESETDSESDSPEQEQESAKRRLATEFDELGHAAAGLGLHAHASEAFSRASELHAAVGDERPASASARLSEEQVAACGGVRSPFVTTPPPVQLSGREYEIALQASLGRSNRQIADDLVLSVRTVETHLLRVYRKLGVGGRSDLVDALPLAGRNAG